MHAREKTIAPYRERYRKKGWNDWRATRVERQQKMGLLPDGFKPAPYPGNVPDWAKDKHKDWQAERMAVYAAQISNVDRGVGRMLEVLKKSGQLDDTLILFLSDNGAAPTVDSPQASRLWFHPQFLQQQLAEGQSCHLSR